MKKLVLLFAAATFIISCGNNNNSSNNNAGGSTSGSDTATSATTGTDATAPSTGGNTDADKGLNLIAQSDCLTCHKIEEKLVGPAYRDVAKKYPNTPEMIDSLSNKVIHGGSGNWGPVAMTPHPALSKADAELMVKYILSLKQ